MSFHDELFNYISLCKKVFLTEVELFLSESADADMEWVGNDDIINELKVAWMIVDENDQSKRKYINIISLFSKF